MRSLILSLLLFATTASAEVFLDLDIGMHVADYHDHQPDGTNWLGDENPLGVIRAGFQTGRHPLSGGASIRGRVYFEHMSSIPDGGDTGINVLMLGVRLGYD